MQRKNNPNLASVLQTLSDGEIHDGNALGEALGLTRAAVWKMIQKLQGLGVGIESVKGKGYLLSEPLILLDPKKIKSGIKHKIKLSVFESLASTNDYLLAEAKASLTSVCLSEMQTAGRGRRGRTWVSPFGQNIYLSLRYHFDKDISELSGLSLMVSLSILKALHTVNRKVFVKWPNDVVCDNGKLAGSLIDIKAESNGGCEAVIGIGLNVNMRVAKGVTQPWTSLQQLTGDYHDRNHLAVALINTLLEDLHQFEQHGFSDFKKSWMQHDYYANKKIQLIQGEHVIEGLARGVNDAGHLLLALSNGTEKAYASGDTQLRPRR